VHAMGVVFHTSNFIIAGDLQWKLQYAERAGLNYHKVN
jgi:hypothetical protein